MSAPATKTLQYATGGASANMATPKEQVFNQGASLVSAQNRVQSPFIIVKIGEYTLGDCQRKEYRDRMRYELNIKYPNFVNSLRVSKVNGTVNRYTLTLDYAIAEGDDPNLLDKIISSVSNSRIIYITYGDWEIPNYIYREEEAIITKVSTNVNFGGSSIQYVINAVSNSLALQSSNGNFPAYAHRKPSDVIKQLLRDNSSQIADIFPGMRDATKVNLKNLIADDDQEVAIPAKIGTNVLDYISFLVNYMISSSDSPLSTIKKNVYYWYVCDDINNEFGGPYFKVVRVSSNTTTKNSYNTYEVDVGYPTANYVESFSVSSDESWSILYDYSQKVKMPEYSYKIDDNGDIVDEFSPMLTHSKKYYSTTEADRTWWSKMTMFPIKATLTIKGLLRPAMLMQNIKINSYFYGRKHTSSGLYVISGQEDSIDARGYKTTLQLIRISSDDDLEVPNESNNASENPSSKSVPPISFHGMATLV